MAETADSAGRSCKPGDLKGLLHAIVDQISDADRRHSETLNQMQERLSAMGHEARSMRTRVPENFQPAFERIEAGMSELASRIAEVNRQSRRYAASAAVFATEPKVVAHVAPQCANKFGSCSAASSSVHCANPAHAAEPPMALRSALDQNQQRASVTKKRTVATPALIRSTSSRACQEM